MNALLISIQCRLGALQAYMEGMKAENDARNREGLALAYDEKAFTNIGYQMEHLANDAMEIYQNGL
jgi:hypothetical protein